MTGIRRQLNQVLLLLLAVLLSAGTVWAQPLCALRVSVLDESDAPVEDIGVELLQVASGRGTGSVLTEDFGELEIPAEDLAQSGAEEAQAVYQYAAARELEGQVCLTDKKGNADFSALEEGVYLVFERGGQVVSFQPYLVSLPVYVDGRPQFSVSSTPKTSETAVRTLWVSKLWDDGMDQAGRRPKSVEVTVLRDGIPLRRAVLSAANLWQHTFIQLPAAGTYTVKEKPVAGYECTCQSVQEGFILVNTYVGGGGGDPGTKPSHVTVRKVWDDEDNAAGKRPVRITVQLVKDGTVIRTEALSESNRWEYTFTNLDPKGVYTVYETAVADYTATYSGTAASGITITNRYVPGGTDPGTPPIPTDPDSKKVDIPVKKVWDDGDNAAGKRPAQVTVYLVANGSIADTLILTEENNWEGVFPSVPSDLYYSIWEAPPEEYTARYSGDAAQGFVVTNTHTPGTTDPGTPPDPTPPGQQEPEPPVDPGEPPQKPSIPQTGAELGAVWLMLAAGAALMVLGLWDLRRGREET